jgi:hypothetical protein
VAVCKTLTLDQRIYSYGRSFHLESRPFQSFQSGMQHDIWTLQIHAHGREATFTLAVSSNLDTYFSTQSKRLASSDSR